MNNPVIMTRTATMITAPSKVKPLEATTVILIPLKPLRFLPSPLGNHIPGNQWKIGTTYKDYRQLIQEGFFDCQYASIKAPNSTREPVM